MARSNFKTPTRRKIVQQTKSLDINICVVIALTILGATISVIPAIVSITPTLGRTLISLLSCAFAFLLSARVWGFSLKTLPDSIQVALCACTICIGFDLIYLTAIIALAVR